MHHSHPARPATAKPASTATRLGGLLCGAALYALVSLPAQAATSEALIRRDEFVMSGCSSPTPEQKSLMPPPEPVLSMTGVRKVEVFPNCSATAVANGKTVDEPTIRMTFERRWST